MLILLSIVYQFVESLLLEINFTESRVYIVRLDNDNISNLLEKRYIYIYIYRHVVFLSNSTIT